MIECPICDGNGENHRTYNECRRCNGSGVLTCACGACDDAYVGEVQASHRDSGGQWIPDSEPAICQNARPATREEASKWHDEYMATQAEMYAAARSRHAHRAA